MNLRVRDARPADLPALAAIYNHWISHGEAIFQNDTNGLQILTSTFDLLSAPDRFFVAELDGAVVGHVVSGPFRPRPLYDVRELSVYVSPDHGGLGIGRALYAAILAALDAAGVHSLIGVVALPNAASAALHTALGFRCVGTFSELGHKNGRRIDCAFWQRMNPLPH